MLLVLASSCELALSQLLAGCGTLQAWAGETASLVTPVSSYEAVAENSSHLSAGVQVALKLTPDTRRCLLLMQGQRGWWHLPAANHGRWSVPRSHSPAKIHRDTNTGHPSEIEKPAKLVTSSNCLNSQQIHLDSWASVIGPATWTAQICQTVELKHHFSCVIAGVQKSACISAQSQIGGC